MVRERRRRGERDRIVRAVNEVASIVPHDNGDELISSLRVRTRSGLIDGVTIRKGGFFARGLRNGTFTRPPGYDATGVSCKLFSNVTFGCNKWNSRCDSLKVVAV